MYLILNKDQHMLSHKNLIFVPRYVCEDFTNMDYYWGGGGFKGVRQRKTRSDKKEGLGTVGN